MAILFQLLFILITGFSVYVFVRKAKSIKRNINLGREEQISGDADRRWRNVFLLAFGQQKMFKKPLVAILHLIVYAGFIIINTEILEIILDGILGTHRLFAPYMGPFYIGFINIFEILALLVLIACVIFLIRRVVIKIPRFNMKEMMGWPKEDGIIILVSEIILMSLFLKMNAADSLIMASEGHPMEFIVSKHLMPFFEAFSIPTLHIFERVFWWFHIIGIYLFLNYLPYSKHLHILLAFPNSYYASLEPEGEMQNMENIQNEVKYAMDPASAPPAEEMPTEVPGQFGAKDIFDLSWKNLLDAYTCTECGRCTEQCPANSTGKLLSPRDIMMKTRDRVEEIGKNIDKNGEYVKDDKNLLHDYITVEELRACTTCQACVEACPVSISPLSIITQLRRQLIMEESNSPPEWNLMFTNIETNMAPWKFSPDDRDAWTQSM